MTRRTIRYQPALDGVRALAVSVVLLFHGGISWMSGGYLGVSVFFTLSGFLITSLLLKEHTDTGRVAAAAFYTRRARRLLPASLLCLVLVSLAGWAGWFRGVADLRRDVWAALFQVFNWFQLNQGYGDLFAKASGNESPLVHYWSLAIEEQFYWTWPLLFMGLMWLARKLRRYPLTLVAWLTLISAVAAPLIAAFWSTNAAYLATPARISEILMGALAACWVFGRDLSPRWRVAPPVAVVALLAACVLFPTVGGPAYHGALPLVAVCSAALIVGLQVEGPVRVLLSQRPVVGLGKVSYGVYLYHWPVYIWVDRQHWDLNIWVSLALKLLITMALTLASYFLLERPIRTATWLPPRRTLVAALGGTALVAGLAFVVPRLGDYYGVDDAAAEAASIDTGPVAPLVPSTTVAQSTVPDTTAESVPAEVTTTVGPTTTTQLVPPRPVRILVMGDSTAEAVGAGLVAWAAANPEMAQVQVEAGAGCGLSLEGYLVFDGLPERDIAAQCGTYVEGLAGIAAEVKPDVVMLITTTWDVADRRVEAGGPRVRADTPEALAQIARSFQTVTDSLLAAGVPRVVWIKEPLPIMGMLGVGDPQGDIVRHQALYGVMDAMAAANPAVRAVDLNGWVDDADLEIHIPSRPDAVHWTAEASLRIADEFLGQALVQAALT